MRTQVEDGPTSNSPRDWRDLALGMLLLVASVVTSAGLAILAHSLSVAG